jgi:site-specific DNA-cytosine methylase
MLVAGPEPYVVFDKEVYNSGIGANGGHYISEDGFAPTLRTKCTPGVCIRHVVRRLTPLECCRLQGFPDYWMDGVPGSDSAKYKMWGNGMALPNMLFVMRRIAEREVAA